MKKTLLWSPFKFLKSSRAFFSPLKDAETRSTCVVRMKCDEAHSSPVKAAEIMTCEALHDCCVHTKLVLLFVSRLWETPAVLPHRAAVSIWECLRPLCCAKIRAAEIHPTCFYDTFLLICKEGFKGPVKVPTKHGGPHEHNKHPTRRPDSRGALCLQDLKWHAYGNQWWTPKWRTRRAEHHQFIVEKHQEREKKRFLLAHCSSLYYKKEKKGYKSW